ncbi:MAG: response regulator transcription factor [Clostridiales bacterium]|nr:response regulator transcription factor [Clostridiales bacterium]
MAQSILLVEDEREIAGLVTLYLENEGFAVSVCHTGMDALREIQDRPVYLAILDVMLPDRDGFQLCRAIRERHTYPVIMLTARDREADKINGLALGADDYVTKPFQPLELVARVKAQLRRYLRYSAADTRRENLIHLGALVIDRDKHQCTLKERPLSLTPTEFAILAYLCENRGRVVGSEELFQAVWGEKYFTNSSNTVMVHIRHLREKMGDSAENPKYIRNVWGVGYQIET